MITHKFVKSIACALSIICTQMNVVAFNCCRFVFTFVSCSLFICSSGEFYALYKWTTQNVAMNFRMSNKTCLNFGELSQIVTTIGFGYKVHFSGGHSIASITPNERDELTLSNYEKSANVFICRAHGCFRCGLFRFDAVPPNDCFTNQIRQRGKVGRHILTDLL